MLPGEIRLNMDDSFEVWRGDLSPRDYIIA